MLVVMVVHDTVENGRAQYTRQAVVECERQCRNAEVDFVVVYNGCDESEVDWMGEVVVRLPQNIGTARAVNIALQQRKAGEHVVKIDNDVTCQDGWIEVMQALLDREEIGVACLKRKDLLDRPGHEKFPTTLELLGGNGQPWVAVEWCDQQMGTVMGMSGKLLDKVGGMWQPGLYGFDDADMCNRSRLAGFRNCYVPCVEIEHLDTGGTVYTDWKVKAAGDDWGRYCERQAGYADGSVGLRAEIV